MAIAVLWDIKKDPKDSVSVHKGSGGSNRCAFMTYGSSGEIQRLEQDSNTTKTHDTQFAERETTVCETYSGIQRELVEH
jgi:hypothetical protein